MKSLLHACTATACLVLVAACQSTRPGGDWLASLQPNAIKTATARGQQELGCGNLTASVLSAKEAPPAFQSARFVTPERGVFGIGVEGCGKRASYLVICERDLAKDCEISTLQQ